MARKASWSGSRDGEGARYGATQTWHLLAPLLLMPPLGAVSLAWIVDNLHAVLLFSCSYAGVLAALVVSAPAALDRRRVATHRTDQKDVIELLLQDAGEGGAGWLWQTDAARQIISPSPRFADRLGTTPSALAGAPLIERLAGDRWQSGACPAALHRLAEHLMQRESFAGLVIPVEAGGACRWWKLSGWPRTDEVGRFIGFGGVAWDVTAQRQTAEQMTRLAHVDAVTGLFNRAHLLEALDRSAAAAGMNRPGCALLIIAIDRLDAVNDTVGHHMADMLLVEAAQRLRERCGAGEICGRIADDHFAILIARATPDDIGALAATLVAALSAPYVIDGQAWHIGISIGSAVSPSDGRNAVTLLRSARLALKPAREKGDARHHAYEPQLHARAEDARRIEMALRQALAEEQMHLLYQPFVDTERGDLKGFEATLRWDHCLLANAEPAHLAAIASKSNLRVQIDDWLLRGACRDAAAWPQPAYVAVRLSRDAMRDGGLTPGILSALHDANLDPARLELVLSEAPRPQDADALAMLDQLRAFGVRFSLEGAGLVDAPVHRAVSPVLSSVRIDSRSIADTSRRNVSAVLMATNVATEQGYDIARRRGCTLMQGDYFASPMTAREAELLLAPSDQ